MKVSFDFDGTLQSYKGEEISSTISKVKEHIKKGDDITFITRRGYFDNHVGINGKAIEDFIKSKFGKEYPVIFTNGLPKFRAVLNNNINLHYDDDFGEIRQLDNFNIPTQYIDVDESDKREESLKDYPDLSKKKILVIDSGGLYISFAERLSWEYGTVYYHCDWTSDSFPESYKKSLGTGIPGVTKIDSIKDVKYQVDVIFFPDCNKGLLQQELEKDGFICFGAGKSTELELNRKYFKDKMKEWRLPIGTYKEIVGIESLLEYLSQFDLSKDPKFVKISYVRGDMETYGCFNWINTQSHFKELEVKIGAESKNILFIVEDNLEGQEAGIDSYCIKGQFPKIMLGGYELKDKAYCGRMFDTSILPEGMKKINEVLGNYCSQCDCSTFLSTEERINKGNYYLTDPTMRGALPPNECQQVNWRNVGNIILKGAEGNLEEPDYKSEFVAQIILTSDDLDSRWLNVTYDKRFERQIRFYNYCVDENGVTCIPAPNGHIICSVVGTGDTLEEACQQACEIAKSVKTDGIEFNKHCFSDINEIIEEGKKAGVTIF